MIQIFSQENILPNDICEVSELLLSFTNFGQFYKCNILQLAKALVCKFCRYSPVTQIAGISYWYFKVLMIQIRSSKSIYEFLLISQNSVYLY